MSDASHTATATEVGAPQGTIELWGPGSTVGSYRIARWLGQGGMGAVYEAVDLEDGFSVALKVLRRSNARFMRLLKREFRRASAVRHPNLVELYELHAGEGTWFFTMELLRGTDLLTHIWGTQRPPHLDGGCQARLRSSLTELSLAIDALHAEGLLHLDVKPSNSLVASDGRLRLFDFGLVSELDEQALSTQPLLSGTPGYMPPEALAKKALGPAADWFSFGVVLYEALTGQKPFASELSARLREPSPQFLPPQQVARNVPADLSELCMALLSTAPAERPTGESIRRVLSATGKPSAQRDELPPPVLFGRDAPLAILEDHLARAREGVPSWIEVEADAGMGKSTLLGRFAAQARQAGALVFFGRCFERETVAHPGFDEIAEQLADHVGSLEPQLRAPLEADLSLAAHLLPVLADGLLSAPSGGPVDRTQGSAALKRILGALCQEQTVVLVLDDLQWARADSLTLLLQIVTRPRPEKLLVVTAARSDAERSTEGALVAVSRPEQLRPTRVHLGRLSDEHAHALVSRLVPNLEAKYASAIVAEAAGSPRLIEALARHARVQGTVASLEQSVAADLARLSSSERCALELLALFEHPLPQGLWLRAAGLGAERPRVLAAFRHAKLIRTTGALAHDVAILDHAAIAKVLLLELPAERKNELLEKLGQVLSPVADQEPGLFARYAELVGKWPEAVRYAELAGMHAERQLAFSQAASWYRRAHERTSEAALQTPLLKRRAAALEHAGHCDEAAKVYEALMVLEPTLAREYASAAAQAYFAAGKIQQGLSIVSPTLTLLGAPHPGSTLHLVRDLAKEAARLSLRGISYEPRATQEAARELELADLTWTVAKGVGVVMPMHGLLFNLHSLRAALDAGEPRRVTRVLAILGAHLTVVGGPFANLGKTFSRRASETAEQNDDAYLQGFCAVCAALHEVVAHGHPQRVLALARKGLAELGRSGQPFSWEKDIAIGLVMIAQRDLGQLLDFDRDARQWLSDSTARGNVYAQVLARLNVAEATHAQGRWEEAREMLEPIASWTDIGYTMPHFYETRLRVLIALSMGDPGGAQHELDEQWYNIEKAQLLRHENPGNDIRFMQGLVAMEQARLTRISAKRLRIVRDTAKKLEKSPRLLYRGHGALLSAALDARALSPLALEQRLAVAQHHYEAGGQDLLARCVAFRSAQLCGSQSARAQIERWFSERMVFDAPGFVAAFVPSFA